MAKYELDQTDFEQLVRGGDIWIRDNTDKLLCIAMVPIGFSRMIKIVSEAARDGDIRMGTSLNKQIETTDK